MMKKYTTFLLFVIITIFASCKNDEFVEAESFEEIVKEIADQKNRELTNGRRCEICKFEETKPEVIYCDNGLNEDGENVILQISKGIVVSIVGVSFDEHMDKVKKGATCIMYTGGGEEAK